MDARLPQSYEALHRRRSACRDVDHGGSVAPGGTMTTGHDVGGPHIGMRRGERDRYRERAAAGTDVDTTGGAVADPLTSRVNELLARRSWCHHPPRETQELQPVERHIVHTTCVSQRGAVLRKAPGLRQAASSTVRAPAGVTARISIACRPRSGRVVRAAGRRVVVAKGLHLALVGEMP